MPDKGPYLQAALVCEKALQEQDGVLSAIRIIDRVIFLQDPDGNVLKPQHPLVLVIMLKAGDARGTYKVRIEQEKPSTERDAILTVPMLFEGEERGNNVVINLGWEPDEPGLYWFDVFFEEELLTRMPLRAVFQPAPTVGPGA
jgi:hypothetical protein